MKNNNEYTIINKDLLDDNDFYIYGILTIIIPYGFSRKIEGSALIFYIVWIIMVYIFVIRLKNGFKYNKVNLIVFNSWFGYVKYRIKIKDIVSIRLTTMSLGRTTSLAIAIELYNKKTKFYCIDYFKEDEFNAMISDINKNILKHYLNGDKVRPDVNKAFKCKKIHIKPEKEEYVVILRSYYVLYVLSILIFGFKMCNLYDGWFFFFYLIIGSFVPIFIYKQKVQKRENNIFLKDCIITITNKSIDYNKIIPFEVIERIEYERGIEITLKTGQILYYKICGNQARKRLGIEKIIDEFKRYKKAMRQNSLD
ncbi:MAG: hypothetical protein J6Y82_00300 [Bacteroidales bacterium]|nr:hypothetical protein [Bacteroidales bacterium]